MCTYIIRNTVKPLLFVTKSPKWISNFSIAILLSIDLHVYIMILMQKLDQLNCTDIDLNVSFRIRELTHICRCNLRWTQSRRIRHVYIDLCTHSKPKGSSDLLWSRVVRLLSSVVRLSSVRLFTFSTSSPEPLDGFWWNLVWMKYSRSLTSVVVFRPDPSRGGSKAGQK